MAYYELIYETGRTSVASYDSDEEMLKAVGAHHERATKGMRSLESEPNSPPAERIVRVEKYNQHPDDYNVDQTMSTDVMVKEVTEAIKGRAESGVVSVPDIVAAVRDLSSPLVAEREAHESNFRMKSEKAFTEGWAA